MKFKLDENLGRRAADLFRKAGHDVATVPEQGLCSASDPTVIDVCKAEGRCLVTLDLDFSNPVRFRPADYPGIAVLRLPPRPSPKDLTDSVLTLIDALAQSSIEGKLWIIQRGRVRVYTPQQEPQ
ncbi:DUF5615 family PIN-like protein [Sorangium sp. So ce281]|uniref:DUF5615 family PIN-like protein n=1 Tax=unclassified Sorangium TaxID=2621164 RepID=UPI003F63D476